MDSSHPDIGSKSVPYVRENKTVPVDEPASVKPMKKADGIDFDFEPKTPKNESTVKPVSPIAPKVVPVESTQPVVRQQPVEVIPS